MARQIPKQRKPLNTAGSGRIATAPVQGKFRPLVVRPHPRQAEIDAQPTLVSMPWDGKGVYWRQGNVEFVGKGE